MGNQGNRGIEAADGPAPRGGSGSGWIATVENVVVHGVGEFRKMVGRGEPRLRHFVPTDGRGNVENRALCGAMTPWEDPGPIASWPPFCDECYASILRILDRDAPELAQLEEEWEPMHDCEDTSKESEVTAAPAVHQDNITADAVDAFMRHVGGILYQAVCDAKAQVDNLKILLAEAVVEREQLRGTLKGLSRELLEVRGAAGVEGSRGDLLSEIDTLLQGQGAWVGGRLDSIKALIRDRDSGKRHSQELAQVRMRVDRVREELQRSMRVQPGQPNNEADVARGNALVTLLEVLAKVDKSPEGGG